MSWSKVQIIVAVSGTLMLCRPVWASEAAPLPGTPGSAIPASKTPGTSLPTARPTGTPNTPPLTAPRPTGSPMLTTPVAPPAFSHGLMQMQEELDSQHTVHGSVVNGKGQAANAPANDVPQPTTASEQQAAPPATLQSSSNVDSFFQIPRSATHRTTPPPTTGSAPPPAAAPLLRGPLPAQPPHGNDTTTGSRWARWHLQSQAWKTSQTHSKAASIMNSTADTDVDDGSSDDKFHLGRALYHIFDNMGVPLPYNKDEALAPSLRAQPMELSVVVKKAPNNPNAAQPTTRPSADQSPSAAAKIPMSELEGVELPAPGDAPKTSP